MTETADLFDYAAGKAAKAEGMATVDAGANPAWSAIMQIHTVEVARELRHFTTDDVFHRAYVVYGMTEKTRDRRAMGPVMLRIAKAGVARKANRLPVNSMRKTLHASPIQVWESLIFGT